MPVLRNVSATVKFNKPFLVVAETQDSGSDIWEGMPLFTAVISEASGVSDKYYSFD